MICSRINLNNAHVPSGFDHLNITTPVKPEKLLCGSTCIGTYFHSDNYTYHTINELFEVSVCVLLWHPNIWF